MVLSGIWTTLTDTKDPSQQRVQLGAGAGECTGGLCGLPALYLRPSHSRAQNCRDSHPLTFSEKSRLHSWEPPSLPGSYLLTDAPASSSPPHSPPSRSRLKTYNGQVLTHLQDSLKSDHLSEIFPAWVDIRFWVFRAFPSCFITTTWSKGLITALHISINSKSQEGRCHILFIFVFQLVNTESVLQLVSFIHSLNKHLIRTC